MPDIVLIRRTNGAWARYTDCTAVSLTGQITAYGSVTGDATANTVTVPGSAFLNGFSITFTHLVGGAGLVTGVKYFVINVSGAAFQLSTAQNGTAIDFTSAIVNTSTILLQTDELFVWSTEYRDIFNGSSNLYYSAAGVTSALLPVASDLIYSGAVTITPPTGGVTPSGIGVVPVSTPYSTTSDEIFHNPLRQTDLPRTHWKFIMSTGPSPLYATWADGDIIANNPPNT